MSDYYFFPMSEPTRPDERSTNELMTMRVLDKPDFEQYSDWVERHIYIPRFSSTGGGIWDNIVKTVENGRGGL